MPGGANINVCSPVGSFHGFSASHTISMYSRDTGWSLTARGSLVNRVVRNMLVGSGGDCARNAVRAGRSAHSCYVCPVCVHVVVHAYAHVV